MATALSTKRDALWTEANALLKTAEDAKRNLLPEEEQRFDALSSPVASVAGVLTAARQGADERLGGNVERCVQAIGDVVEVAIEGARGDTGAGHDPLRGGAEIPVLVEDVRGAAEQAPALVLGDGRGGEPMAAAGQPLAGEAVASGQSWS